MGARHGSLGGRIHLSSVAGNGDLPHHGVGDKVHWRRNRGFGMRQPGALRACCFVEATGLEKDNGAEDQGGGVSHRNRTRTTGAAVQILPGVRDHGQL